MGHSIRRVENHWFRPSLSRVSGLVSGLETLHRPVLNQFQKEKKKSVAGLVISYHCAKYRTQPNEGRIYCSSAWQGSRTAGVASQLGTLLCSPETEMNGRESVFLIFIQSGHSAHRTAPPHSGRVSPHSPFRPSQTHPERHSQGSVSMVSPVAVEVTVTINRRFGRYLESPDDFWGKLSSKSFCKSVQLRRAGSKGAPTCANKCAVSRPQSQVGGGHAWTGQTHLRQCRVSPKPL